MSTVLVALVMGIYGASAVGALLPLIDVGERCGPRARGPGWGWGGQAGQVAEGRAREGCTSPGLRSARSSRDTQSKVKHKHKVPS
eukprot:1159029-Pelagomonas_calceolata.AAC.9